MNKIIFLDIDGVLNTVYYQGMLQHKGEPWQDEYGALFDPDARNNATFRSTIDIIISIAKDTYRSIFSREESKTIKSVMEAFGKDKEDYRSIGTFLMFTADKKENLSNSEYRKTAREVDDFSIGRYEQAQKRRYSMKM